MRVYIAGPMTSIPLYNFPAFDAAAGRWRLRGHHVASPADISRDVWVERHGREFDPSADRCEYGDDALTEMFARDLAAVCAVDALAFLPGWENSKGAQLEAAIAKQLGKRFFDAMTFAEIDIAVVVRALVIAESVTQ